MGNESDVCLMVAMVSYAVLMKKEEFYADDGDDDGVDPMIGIFLHLNFDAHSIEISLFDEYDDDEAMVIVNNDVTMMMLKAY